MVEPRTHCDGCHTHWSDCDVLADGTCASCQHAEVTRLRDAVLFFARHYDGPPDNMLSERDRELFQVPEEIRTARAAGGE